MRGGGRDPLSRFLNEFSQAGTGIYAAQPRILNSAIQFGARDALSGVIWIFIGRGEAIPSQLQRLCSGCRISPCHFESDQNFLPGATFSRALSENLLRERRISDR